MRCLCFVNIECTVLNIMKAADNQSTSQTRKQRTALWAPGGRGLSGSANLGLRSRSSPDFFVKERSDSWLRRVPRVLYIHSSLQHRWTRDNKGIYLYIYKRNIYLYHIIDIYTHMQATYGIVSAFLATAVHFRRAPLHAPKPMRPKTPPVCSDAPAGLGRKIKESEVIHNGIGVSVCP